MSLFPTSTEETGPDEPQLVGFDDETADAVLSALSSATARKILIELNDEPATPSKLANHVDMTVQNVLHHLTNLEEAGVIEIVDTVYSEKGREMKVYAPRGRPLILISSGEEETSELKSAIARLLGSIAILGLLSLLIQTSLPDVPSPQEIVNAAGTPATPPPPGLVFFAGGLTVLAAWFTLWYLRRVD